MEKQGSGNSTLWKGRAKTVFWGVLVIAGVLLLFSLVYGHSQDARCERTSCNEKAEILPQAGFSPWCTGKGRVLEALDLNEEQRDRVEAVLEEALERISTFRQQHHELRERLARALKAEEVNEAELSEIREAYLQLLDQASLPMLRAMADLAEGLTPEQRVALLDRACDQGHRH